MVLLRILVILVGVWLVVMLFLFFPVKWLILVLALLLTGFGLILGLAWLVLAPRNMFFTFVDEGTAKIVVRGGQVVKALVQLKDCTLDTGWNVILGQEWHPFGGLRWIGIWPFNEIYIYVFRWTNVLPDGRVREHSGEWLDYILLKQDVYYFAETTAEDADLLPLKVEILLTLRIINPYKALFAVQDWLETIVNRYRPAVRDRVAQDRYETLIRQKGSMASELFASSENLRQAFFDQYGVEVIAVEVKNIEPPEDYRDETLRRWEAERDAERVRVSARAQADRIDAEYSAVRRHGIKGLIIRWLEGRK